MPLDFVIFYVVFLTFPPRNFKWFNFKCFECFGEQKGGLKKEEG